MRLAVMAAAGALLVLFMTDLGAMSPLLLGLVAIVATAGLDGVHPVRHVVGHTLSLVGMAVGIAAQVLALIEKGEVWASTAGTLGTSVGGTAIAASGVLACRAIKGKRLRTAWLLLPAALPLLYVLG